MKNKLFFLSALLFCFPAEARTFTDSAGRTLEIPDRIDRVVPSGPVAQMFLLTIAPEKVVALSNREKLKTQLSATDQKKRLIGQFYGASSLNLEELAVINPQLFIDIGEAKKKIQIDMNVVEKQLGLQAVHIDSSLKNTPKSLLLLGELLNLKNGGADFSTATQAIYDKVSDILSKVPSKKRLLYVTGGKALSVLGKGSYHGQVIDLMGDNVAVFPTVMTTGSGNDANLEQILSWDPEYLIADRAAYEFILKSPAWQSVRAVKEKRLYRVPDHPYNWITSPPAVNRFIGLLWLAKVLYPDLAKFDLYEETKRFYQLFYRTDLTKEQYQSLVGGAI